MDDNESRRRFKEADALYRAGRYGEALALLEALDRAYPNAKNVLYPLALCLEKQGRAGEALAICDRLIGQFQDPRAVTLKQRIRARGDAEPRPSTALADLGLTGAADLFDLDRPSAVPAYAPVEPESNWLRYTLIGAGVCLLLALLIVPPLMYEAPPEPPPGSAGGQSAAVSPEDFARAIGLGMILTLVAASFTGSVAGGYLALFLMNQLPSREVMDNLISLAFTMFLVNLAGFVPIVGVIAGLVIISKVYDLGCGGLLMFVLLSGFMSALFTAVPLMFLVASLSAVAPV